MHQLRSLRLSPGNPHVIIDNLSISYETISTSYDTVCNYSKNGYRYGFNGMEKVNVIAGDGNDYDFGARIYDGRLGRWFSVDPFFEEYDSYSPNNFGLNSPISYSDYQGYWIVGSDGKPVSYKRNEDGTITWSPNATADIIKIGNAMLTTPMGETTFNKWMNAKTRVKLKYDTIRRKRNASAVTRHSSSRKLNGDGQYNRITVVVFEKSILSNIGKTLGESRWGGAGFEEALGAVATHEVYHNEPAQIQNDIDVSIEQDQDPTINLPVNAEVDFRRQYNNINHIFYNFWELNYKIKGYQGIDDNIAPSVLYFDPPIDTKPKENKTQIYDDYINSDKTYSV